MSLYEIRFIKEANDPDDKHLVVDVEAFTPEEAEKKAREKMEAENKWLAPYRIWVREVKHF